MGAMIFAQCSPNLICNFVRWYLSPGAPEEGPHEALFAIASVSAVLWTGGLLLRDRLSKKPADATADFLRLNIAMDALQTSFVGAIIALLATPIALRSIALSFFVYYATADVIVARASWGRLRWWLLGEGVIDAAMLFIAIFPQRGSAAWACLMLLGLGYQLMLKLFYQLPELRNGPIAPQSAPPTV